MGDFFLGITLPDDLAEEVENLRRRFTAPRTAPHITLLPPFTWSGNDHELVGVISIALAQCSPPTIRVEGLGHFGRGVLYINVELSSELGVLHGRLKRCLEERGVGDFPGGRPYHPHITLATRLTPDDFHRYSEELSGYSPSQEFECRDVALFGMQVQGRFRRWQVIKQIPLK